MQAWPDNTLTPRRAITVLMTARQLRTRVSQHSHARHMQSSARSSISTGEGSADLDRIAAEAAAALRAGGQGVLGGPCTHEGGPVAPVRQSLRLRHPLPEGQSLMAQCAALPTAAVVQRPVTGQTAQAAAAHIKRMPRSLPLPGSCLQVSVPLVLRADKPAGCILRCLMCHTELHL